MPKKIKSPTTIDSVGNKPKTINEFIGLVNSKTSSVSIAHMQSSGGWTEPGQRPDFDEYTIILKGRLKVETEDDILYINSEQAIITYGGEWVNTVRQIRMVLNILQFVFQHLRLKQ